MQIGVDSFAAAISDPLTGQKITALDRMQHLLSRINEDYDRAPSEEQTSEMAAVRNQVDEQVRSFNALLSDDVGKFNKMAADTGANTLYAGPAIALRGERPQTRVSGGR